MKDAFKATQRIIPKFQPKAIPLHWITPITPQSRKLEVLARTDDPACLTRIRSQTVVYVFLEKSRAQSGTSRSV
ncbi:hypothetical protein WAI453_012890 [Rhynchosporium graminicola]